MSATAPSWRAGRVVPAPANARPREAAPAWRAYLVLAAALLPVLQPIGGQAVVVDLLNMVAIACFLVWALATRPRLEIPFLVPATVIAAASLLAITNAASARQSFVALVQDAYLYLWFVVLVNLMLRQRDLGAVRVAWAIGAGVASVAGVAMLLAKGIGPMEILGPKGERATGWTSNANLYADFLAVSFFVAITAAGRLPKLVHWGVLAAIFAALLSTKSLGGMVSWFAGLAVYLVARTLTRRPSAVALFSTIAVVGGVGFLGWWTYQQITGSRQEFEVMTEGSMVGRFDKSSESRFEIWRELGRQYAENPLGIGPGNSRFRKLTGPASSRSLDMAGKEAHSDYIGYAIERGPLALLALLVMTVAALRRAWRGWSGIPPRLQRGAAGVVASAMSAALVASSVHSFTIEKLHFRHFWMMLALLVVLGAWYAGSAAHDAEPEATR